MLSLIKGGEPLRPVAEGNLLQLDGSGGVAVIAVRLARARSQCRFAPPLIHFIPELLTYSVSLFLERQCDRSLRP